MKYFYMSFTIILLSISSCRTDKIDIPLEKPIELSPIEKFIPVELSKDCFQILSSDHPQIDTVLRITIPEKNIQNQPCGFELMANINNVNTNDILLVEFYGKKVETNNNKRYGHVTVSFGTTFVFPVLLQNKWKKYRTWAFAENFITNDSAALVFECGKSLQTIEIANIKMSNYGANYPIENLNNITLPYHEFQQKEKWEAITNHLIDSLRKTDFTIKIIDYDGNVVPYAEVEINSKKHSFLFGTEINSIYLLGNDSVSSQYKQAIQNDFNWVLIGNNLSEMRYLDNDSGALHEAHEWLTTCNLLREDIYFSPSFKSGANKELISEWFNNHKKSKPYASHFIVLEDYLSVNYINNEQNEYYENLLSFIKKEQLPVDGICLPANYSQHLLSLNQLWTQLDKLSAHHLPIIISDFGIKTSKGRQDIVKQYTSDFLRVCYSHPSVIGFAIDSFWEKEQYGCSSTFYDSNFKRNEVGFEWHNLINFIWGTLDLNISDEQGQCSFRGYEGEYDISIKKDNFKKNFIDVEISKNNNTITLIFDK